MIINTHNHLSYCTNIHPGETWEETFTNLKLYTLKVKENLAPNKAFGIGLRLSQQSAKVLLQGKHLNEFKNWLELNNLYIFTINGFPYGEFHDTVVKDKVHIPDWTTEARLQYSKDLMNILAYLLPENMDGGVSTSPLSYKYWFKENKEAQKAKEQSTKHLMDLVVQLVDIEKNTHKHLHLDIEPEPDGFLENTQEVIDFYNNFLFKMGVDILQNKLKCSTQNAKDYILRHVQICYDVCHFALAYESPEFVISTLKKEGINIGKIQISAAIKCEKTDSKLLIEQQSQLAKFDEPTYLHQSVVKLEDNSLIHFSDLGDGLSFMGNPKFKEIRTHFHIPIFISEFDVLTSTQQDIIDALQIWKNEKYTNHLEVETYTWSILPENLQTNLTTSITRELEWVINQLNTN